VNHPSKIVPPLKSSISKTSDYVPYERTGNILWCIHFTLNTIIVLKTPGNGDFDEVKVDPIREPKHRHADAIYERSIQLASSVFSFFWPVGLTPVRLMAFWPKKRRDDPLFSQQISK